MLSAGLQIDVGALAIESLKASLRGSQKHERRNDYRYPMAIGTQWIGLDWRNGGVPKVACLLQEACIVLTANMTRTSDSPQLVYRSVPKMASSSITREKATSRVPVTV